MLASWSTGSPMTKAVPSTQSSEQSGARSAWRVFQHHDRRLGVGKGVHLEVVVAGAAGLEQSWEDGNSEIGRPWEDAGKEAGLSRKGAAFGGPNAAPDALSPAVWRGTDPAAWTFVSVILAGGLGWTMLTLVVQA